jgi:diguanylate cyclase (GGDEF)-like protein/PAS domain S-box-containing protein
MASQSPKKQLSFDIILAIFLVVLSVLLNQLLLNKIQLLQQWDNLFYDLESTVITSPVNDDIVIVAIDDASLKKLGRWPWSRAIHARLIDQLTTAGVAGIAMDILFMEPDLAHPENDHLLASAIRRNGRTVMPVLTSIQGDHFVITKPLAEIANAAAQLAHVNMHFDSQGIVRQLDLQIEFIDGTSLPAMSLALSRLLPKHIEPPNLTEQKSVLINFVGPPGQFQHISYADIIQDEEIQKNLSGKVVFIGMTAAGLGSSIATPASNSRQLMSGIEFQANALATIQSGQIIRPLQWPAYTLVSLFLIVIPIILFRFFRPSHALLLALSFSIITAFTSIFLLSELFLWFSPLPTLLCLILSYPLWSWQRLEQLGHSLFKEHERANATLKAIGDAVITTDQKGYIEFMNPAAEKLLASPLAEVKHKLFSEICQIIDQTDSTLLDSRTFIAGKRQTETQVIRNQKGEEYAVHISSSLIHAKNKRPIGVVYALNDLTEIITINRKIAFIASHDVLTGLPNRVLFQDRLEQAIIMAKRENLNFAVLFIDLDGFKKINDAMGHASGDLLLQEVAERLCSLIRKSDTLSRWGGDEFIILLENLTSLSDAADIATNIIHSLSFSIVINGQEVFVTPSIGISLFPEDGKQAEVLLAKSDTAMYNVKNSGRNNFCFYSQKLENQAKERLILETELRMAIKSGEFEMYYQPQIDITSNQLIGAEALIRWNHPDKGLVFPNKFIPLAEDTGLIVPIGEWIIKTVCLQLKSWKTQGFPLVKVAINLSAQQFVQKDLVSIITREIKKQGLSPESIQVEITESMMIQDIDRVTQVLDNLKSAGISIAVDDFGTGYSSLEHLKRFPIDKLKIDKSFIDSILHNADDACIVEAVIALGHNMNMQIIAEGVENEHQARFLKEHHCDYGQGYFYSKPLPAQKMELLIKQFTQQNFNKLEEKT